MTTEIADGADLTKIPKEQLAEWLDQNATRLGHHGEQPEYMLYQLVSAYPMRVQLHDAKGQKPVSAIIDVKAKTINTTFEPK